jgi:hypothetical protein
MTQPQFPQRPTQRPHDRYGGHGRGGHRWMMLACCVPMLVITIVLVATGIASARFLAVAIICTAMMAMMMGDMGHGDDHRRH